MTNNTAAVLRLEIGQANKTIRPGKLALHAGSNPKGESFGFTNFYMTRNGEPVIPVVGEFHFSRFSYLHWEEELLKMKAGGVHLVATYVFWNFHEEEEGVFDWSGNRNLRHFIDLCAKHELPLILRIGPFCHGEVRNGGIPDWVFRYPLEVRSNDERYLSLARRLYREIARQIQGTYYQEGGPVIAVQLENEYMHAGAPLDAWGYSSGQYVTAGTDGSAHLDELRRIAEEVGIRPLFFTATAWGGAAVPEEGTLPMLAGYAYTPWIPNQPPSREFLFQDLHVTPAEPVNYDSLEYPVAYCEMAGGMQVSYKARPYVPAESIEAMTLVKMGSGSNLLGYYMYHGGSNPVGRKTFLNESGLPKITYDYQSPLGEFGRVGDSYDRIRTISLFLQAFGHLLAPMGTVLPAGQEHIAPEDTHSVRWCVRQKDGSGFVFLNNFQDHVDLPDRRLRIELDTPQGKAFFPQTGEFTLRSRLAAILPFNLELDGLFIVSATVQLLTRLEAEDETLLVFFAHDGMEPEIVIRKSSVSEVGGDGSHGAVKEDEANWIVRPATGRQHQIRVKTAEGRVVRLVTLTRDEALLTYRFDGLWGHDRLVISTSHLAIKDGQLICTSPGQNQVTLSLYPAPVPSAELRSSAGVLQTAAEPDGSVFQTYTLDFAAYLPELTLNSPSDRSVLVDVPADWPESVSDVWLRIEYDGDVAAAYLGDRMLTDHIHYGQHWEIGLKQVRHELENHPLHLSITPLRRGTVHSFVNQAYVERFEGVEIAKIHDIQVIPHYSARLWPQGK
ncbi:beta-galactosidase [Paenibacillus sp. p3-SID1389]|uniref:beta-galactosidase n=1 Tax=Paenibacillus sp. p3-SID1389 TaxID=2916364 RepID=UPI0021A3DAF5|nr:beta-galactosidase [Paenibacillus sp. p3-SID1389]MCT2196912.1 beta-galactosidase [Paenibacillus sp. p3-SID1389]